jgi:Pyridoxamine 5'-phosphate oxidase
MARWDEVVADAPEFAEEVRRLFDAHRHKTLATIRRDGSPRISGIEATFHDGDLWLGMMEGSLKARDLRRDPRMALHSATVDPPADPTAWEGDAKLTGRAEEITDPDKLEAFRRATGSEGGQEPPGGFHLFRIDLREVVLTRVGDPADHLVIALWREGEGLVRMQRA